MTRMVVVNDPKWNKTHKLNQMIIETQGESSPIQVYDPSFHFNFEGMSMIEKLRAQSCPIPSSTHQKQHIASHNNISLANYTTHEV